MKDGNGQRTRAGWGQGDERGERVGTRVWRGEDRVLGEGKGKGDLGWG